MNIMNRGGKFKMVQDLGGLETIAINHKTFTENREVLGEVLKDAQQFLSRRYPKGEVLSLEWFETELGYAKNDAYNILVRKQPGPQGQIVAVLAYDVARVPKAPYTRKKIISDRKNHYTSLLYAAARGEKYEPELRLLVEQAMQAAQQYSASKHSKNIGILTNDLNRPNVLKELSRKYGGGFLGKKVGVPTLDDETVRADYDNNFVRDHDEKLVAIPLNGKLTKSMAKRLWAHALDDGYNEKKPWHVGYKPLTNAPYFKDFAVEVDAMPGRNVTFRPIK